MEILDALDAIPAAELRASARQSFDQQALIQRKQTNSRPEIDFTFLPDHPKAGEPCLIYVRDFVDLEGILVDMNWSIAGEAGTKGPVVLHVFDKPGRYPVSLTVTNNFGAEGICERAIPVG